MALATVAVVAALVLGGCSLIDSATTTAAPETTGTSADSTSTEAPATPDPQPPPLPPEVPAGLCESYGDDVVVTGTVANADVREASGIAASRAHPGVIWMHNDSGDDPIVYAIAEDGTSLAAFEIDAPAFDWEDMDLGPGPEPGRDYLYLGDIGDNLHFRPVITVHRIPEPDIESGTAVITPVESFNLRYPEPGPDSEAMLVDPVTGDILVVTKGDSGEPSLIFRARSTELTTGETTNLEQIGTFELEAGVFVTAADIDSTGAAVVFRGYNQVWLWERTDTDFIETFAAEPCRTPSTAEVQGEAISFAATGFGYFTVSEGPNPDINFVASTIDP